MSGPDFADCTVQNHFWSRRKAERNPSGTITVTFECQTCHKRKYVTYSVQGLFVISRRYEHPPGYLLPPVESRITRSEWREIYLKRLISRRKK